MNIILIFKNLVQMSVLKYAWYSRLRMGAGLGFFWLVSFFSSLSMGPSKIASDFAKRADISYV